VQIPASCWLVQAGSVIEGVFGLSLSVLSNIAAAVSGEARGFKVGVKGEDTGGGVSSGAWGPGAVPPEKNFKLQMHACEF
jgi:hypothetical protein